MEAEAAPKPIWLRCACRGGGPRELKTARARFRRLGIYEGNRARVTLPAPKGRLGV